MALFDSSSLNRQVYFSFSISPVGSANAMRRCNFNLFSLLFVIGNNNSVLIFCYYRYNSIRFRNEAATATHEHKSQNWILSWVDTWPAVGCCTHDILSEIVRLWVHARAVASESRWKRWIVHCVIWRNGPSDLHTSTSTSQRKIQNWITIYRKKEQNP